jgi:cysteine desulfurase
MIYFDNNATTLIPRSVEQEMVRWVNCGNPSATHKHAKICRAMMDDFKRAIIAEIFNSQNLRDKFEVHFTSGASESNSHILRSVADSYYEIIGNIPHFIIGACEHKSIICGAEELEKRGRAEITFIKPRIMGDILPEDIGAAIKSNTCLICIMHVNNETGVINNVREIGELAHRNNVPFHCDIVQSFCKMPIDSSNIDSMSISFHKIGGPPGVGALVIRREFKNGFKLGPIIYGTQSNGFRGGTENIIGIGASFHALKLMCPNTTENFSRMKSNTNSFEGQITREQRIKRYVELRNYILSEINKHYNVRTYCEYIQGEPRSLKNNNKFEIVILSAANGTMANAAESCGKPVKYLPNTLLISVVKREKPYVCNVSIKEELEKRGIIISVGSACNSSSDKASHVLYSLNADEYIRKGTLRISFSHYNTLEEAKKFVREFLAIIRSLC